MSEVDLILLAAGAMLAVVLLTVLAWLLYTAYLDRIERRLAARKGLYRDLVSQLATRDRALLVLAMTAALGRMEEFRLHVGARSRTGVSDDELDELLFQIAAYCGAPAGISARRQVKAVRAERES